MIVCRTRYRRNGGHQSLGFTKVWGLESTPCVTSYLSALLNRFIAATTHRHASLAYFVLGLPIDLPLIQKRVPNRRARRKLNCSGGNQDLFFTPRFVIAAAWKVIETIN